MGVQLFLQRDSSVRLPASPRCALPPEAPAQLFEHVVKLAQHHLGGERLQWPSRSICSAQGFGDDGVVVVMLLPLPPSGRPDTSAGRDLGADRTPQVQVKARVDVLAVGRVELHGNPRRRPRTAPDPAHFVPRRHRNVVLTGHVLHPSPSSDREQWPWHRSGEDECAVAAECGRGMPGLVMRNFSGTWNVMLLPPHAWRIRYPE